MKKNKRFRAKSGRRRGQAARQLKRQVDELRQSGDLDSWDDRTSEARRKATPPPSSLTEAEESPRESLAWDGPRYGALIASLASGVAWLIPDSHGPDDPVLDERGTGEPWPLDADGTLLSVLPSALAHDQRSRIAVGDRVSFAPIQGDYKVLELEPRRSFLARPDPLNPHLQRIVVANVDVVVQVASVRKPPLRPALIDRYLIAIQQGGAEPILAVNKIDLVPESEREAELAPLDAYRGLDLPILPCSVKSGRGLAELRAHLRGKTVAFVGHSGVGKSSLINALAPEVDAEVGEVSEALNKGRHTTTRSNLYPLGDGIQLIDTPGIREMGLLRLDSVSLREYFPDFAQWSPTCRFGDCTHSHEPGCAVRQAADQGDLSGARYATYLRILASLDDDGK